MGGDKTMLKEIKELCKWKEIPCPCIGRLNIIKIDLWMQSLSKSQ